MSYLLGVFSKLSQLLPGFRKKKNTIETLEELDKEIKAYEKYKQASEYNEKKYVGALLLYSIVLYIFGAVFYYIYLMPKKLGDRVKTLIPFFIMPLMIFLIRKFLKWFYIKRQENYGKKLNDLKEEKKNILEEVKEKETYKKAREILERFSSGVDVQITPPTSPQGNQSIYPSSTPSVINNRRMQLNETAMLNSSNMTMNGTTLVHRNVKQIQQQNMSIYQGPKPGNNLLEPTKSQSNLLNASTMSSSSNVQSSASNLGPSAPAPTPQVSQQRTLLPRPIIAPNRTIFDKILDFFIGEGPNNRFALICKSCHFHNGMALKEEFEYVAFRCAYCLFYNESRKTKLAVPSIQRPNSITGSNMNESNTSTSNLSSAASFDDDAMAAEPTSEPIISAASLERTSKDALSNSSQKSFDNLNLNDEDLVKRKSSLTDSSNRLSNGIIQNRRGSAKSVDRLTLSENRLSKEINKENQEDDDMDFEHIENTKKFE